MFSTHVIMLPGNKDSFTSSFLILEIRILLFCLFFFAHLIELTETFSRMLNLLNKEHILAYFLILRESSV